MAGARIALVVMDEAVNRSAQKRFMEYLYVL
jgi:hypothetical protein